MKMQHGRLAAGCALAMASTAPCWAVALSTAPIPADGATPASLRSATEVVATLQNICLPLIEGASLKKVAPANGLKQIDGQWVLKFDRDQRIDLDPPDSVNPNVCSATVVDAAGAQPAMGEAIDQWARSRSPALAPVKIGVSSQGPNYLRTTSTWRGSGPKGTIGVVFSEEKTLAGKPVHGRLDQSELLMSFTPSAT